VNPSGEMGAALAERDGTPQICDIKTVEINGK